MKKCPHCGMNIEESARYCLHCMTPLTEKEVVSGKTEKKSKAKYIVLAALLLVCAVAAVFFALNKGENDTEKAASEKNNDSVEITDKESVPESEDGTFEIGDGTFETGESVTEPQPAGDFQYEIRDGQVTVTRFLNTGFSGTLVIPSEIEGKPVTALSGYVRYEQYGLISPMFDGCDGPIDVVVPSSVRTVESSVFNDSIRSVRFENGIEKIAYGTFYKCRSLREVVLPSSVQRIAMWAFDGCPELEKVVIPPSVTSVDRDAVYNCPKLVIYGEEGSAAEAFANDKNIPFEILNAGQGTVTPETPPVTLRSADTSELLTPETQKELYSETQPETRTVPETEKTPETQKQASTEPVTEPETEKNDPEPPVFITDAEYNGFVYSVADGKATITRCKNQPVDGVITIPSEINGYPVTAITAKQSYIRISVFSGCGEFQTVVPDSVNTIDYAFRGCNVTSVTLPEGLTTLAEHEFEFCRKLKYVKLPSTLTRISKFAFEQATGLEYIVIPRSVSVIEPNAFEGCPAVFYCYKDSCAHQYAVSQRRQFVIIQ